MKSHLAKDEPEKKSVVADNESGQSIETKVGTNSGVFVAKAQDEVVARVEARIAAWTSLPIENGEAIHILHYEHGQKYEPRFGHLDDEAIQKSGAHHVATVVMYLSDVAKGGEMVFPNSQDKAPQPKGEEDWSECAKEGYAVKPYKGGFSVYIQMF